MEYVTFSQGLILSDSTATYDFTAHVVSASLSFDAEIQDITAMTDRFRARIPGLKSWQVEVQFNNDFSTVATFNVAQQLFNAIGSTKWSLTCRVFSTNDRSSANPEYSGAFVLGSNQPFAGGVGEVARQSVTFLGNGALTRTVSAT